MDLISVIVPVYKVEPYLDRCVQSIIDQTYPNLEIILVDDGSPDRCPAMCDAWAKKDNRIKVIHKENGGGAQARNIGLDISSGDFISFVDSDDYISPDMYEHLLSFFTPDIDIVECNYSNVKNDKFIFPDNEVTSNVFTSYEAMKLHIEDSLFRQLIWNKLYRHRTIGNIRFVEGKKIDDEFFTYRVLGNAKTLIHSSKICYAYRQQESSIMHQSFSSFRLEAIDAKYQRLEYLLIRFPELYHTAKIDLWFTCLYMGQMSLKYLDSVELTDSIELLTEILVKLPLLQSDYSLLSLKEKIWLYLAERNFKTVCKFRNFLNIGV